MNRITRMVFVIALVAIVFVSAQPVYASPIKPERMSVEFFLNNICPAGGCWVEFGGNNGFHSDPLVFIEYNGRLYAIDRSTNGFWLEEDNENLDPFIDPIYGWFYITNQGYACVTSFQVKPLTFEENQYIYKGVVHYYCGITVIETEKGWIGKFEKDFAVTSIYINKQMNYAVEGDIVTGYVHYEEWYEDIFIQDELWVFDPRLLSIAKDQGKGPIATCVDMKWEPDQFGGINVVETLCSEEVFFRAKYEVTDSAVIGDVFIGVSNIAPGVPLGSLPSQIGRAFFANVDACVWVDFVWQGEVVSFTLCGGQYLFIGPIPKSDSEVLYYYPAWRLSVYVIP